MANSRARGRNRISCIRRSVSAETFDVGQSAKSLPVPAASKPKARREDGPGTRNLDLWTYPNRPRSLPSTVEPHSHVHNAGLSAANGVGLQLAPVFGLVKLSKFDQFLAGF